MRPMLAACLLLIMASPIEAAPAWEVFISDYSGCSLSFPVAYFSPTETRNSDGSTTFESSLPDTTLALAGGLLTRPTSMREAMQIYVKNVKADSITYRREENHWAVYSGYRQGLIYYARAWLSRDGRKACIFELTYPPDIKLQLDPVIARMSPSLRAAPKSK